MKKKLMLLLICFLVLVFSALVMAFWLYSLTGFLSEINLLAENTGYWISGVGGVAFGLASTIYMFLRMKSIKISKRENWLYLNASKIMLFFIVTIIFFGSYKKEPVWTQETMREIVAIEWTILSISIAIFLVWNVVMLQYFKSIKPIHKSNSVAQKREYIQNKREYSRKVSGLSNSVILLCGNIIFVIIATGLVFTLVEDTSQLLQQGFVLAGFCFCTNTLLSLFFDILQPLNDEKKALLEDSKITPEELEFQNKASQQIKSTLTILEELEKMDSLDNKQKVEIASKLLKDLYSDEVTCIENTEPNVDLPAVP